MALPSFLHPCADSPPPEYLCTSAVFHHSNLGGDAHALWWPALSGKDPESVLLFVPGNPGLVEFYLDFLSQIQRDAGVESMAILAHAHIGHTANLPYTRCDLATQVESAIEALDAIVSEWPKAKVVVISHSMGCWISKQILRARPEKTTGMIFMTPTIRNIADTPNGRMLSWLFGPVPRTILSNLAFVGRVLPLAVLQLLQPVRWPTEQLQALKKMIGSSGATHACLLTAHDEMNMITDMDVALLNEHKDKLRLYFVETDGWVGDHREYIVGNFKGPSENIFLAQDVPHAFCINHSSVAALPVVGWIKDLNL